MISTLPFLASRRPPAAFRPLKAFGHFRKLIADKEDTAQVFYMGECLPSSRFKAAAKAFCESELGTSLMDSQSYLPDILDDHDTLCSLPADSVAHAYVAFMRKEGLSAAGLVEASRLPGVQSYADQLQWLSDRLRDTHDLAHVLTGYGRDALGEQCVLGFTSAQYHDWTEWFIAWAGALELVARVRSDAPVLAAIAEARRHGRAAAALYRQDIRALLAEPLELARERLGIAEPTQYRRAHARYRAKGLDPYGLFAARAA
ncbi:MAG TPA: Coq4 family protein [Phenylobacterium sp.]|jgi:ubiquinone biosynthesis protein COQ4|uniref:Coq4 family protein n=1 Tax=Phenylobacterium sp. TaxID=1871053 RepID=UPI002D348E08|nr:Coq4 family protein [Phenylobacterium sp.]HZZ68714.1 Coq4 family protein [Phenylobacterium sp.]